MSIAKISGTRRSSCWLIWEGNRRETTYLPTGRALHSLARVLRHEAWTREHHRVPRRDRQSAAEVRDSPRGRHQRQGVDVGDDRGGASGAGVPHGAVYVAAPGRFHRADQGVRGGNTPARGSRICRSPSHDAGKKKLSFFELVTALGFDYFARSGVEIAVIETGLGGRLDATNVLTPALTIVTDISFDHMEILGSTLTRIAREKAGIIKPGVPHLIGFLPPAAERVMRTYSRRRHTDLHSVHLKRSTFYPSRFMLDFISKDLTLKHLHPALLGEHQLKNATLALEALALLRRKGIKISVKAIRDGMTNTFWPGRFQIITRPGKPTVVLDVCHNASGVAAFVRTCRMRFPGRRMPVVIGVVRKKEHQEMFDAFSQVASEYNLTPLKTHRSVSPRELQRTIDWKGIPVRRFGSVRSACDTVVKRASADDIILVVGSHYLVGEYLKTYGWS
ncbi:hypothetical protein C3F09_11405 [candidate division GN15 bacterium]|uniref:tetrahydrofolate synthase n=1 Tax=candidate division GN15 bacterium TaxID=2072418 RepID=A0A855WWM6_9BACT|nr:MAG: hypothetical protein C3F09_11405 [candidate division GN15 bacterium]